MNFLIGIIGKKKVNAFFQKLSRCLKRQNPEIKVRSAYFLFGTPYSESTFFDIKNAIAKNELDVFRKNAVLYDVRIDNIELYLIEKQNNQFCIVLLLDAYELYSREEILGIFPVENIDYEKDLIYSEK
jgi:hypothetical protein